MRYTMNLDQLSDASGLSKRRLKDLHLHGLIHSPVEGLWPEENIDLISRYAGTRRDKWIHKSSMRSALIQACMSNGDSCPDHEILVDELSPSDLLFGKDVLRFTKNDNASATIDEVIGECLTMSQGPSFDVPVPCIVKALVLLSEGYSPCWVRNSGGGFRTTIDMVGDLNSPNPAPFGFEQAMGAFPIFQQACESLGITALRHDAPKNPDALLTSNDGENWCEYAVFKNDSGKMSFEAIGILL